MGLRCRLLIGLSYLPSDSTGERSNVQVKRETSSMHFKDVSRRGLDAPSRAACKEDDLRLGHNVRSKAAQAVSEVLNDFAAQGAFRRLIVRNFRVGRKRYELLWHNDRMYQFVLDLDASALHFPRLLPVEKMNSQVLKTIEGFLRSFSTDEVPIDRRVDSSKGELQLFVRRGTGTLTMSVRDGEYRYCARHLVLLAQDILTRFLTEANVHPAIHANA